MKIAVAAAMPHHSLALSILFSRAALAATDDNIPVIIVPAKSRNVDIPEPITW